jgi:carbamoyltransferase
VLEAHYEKERHTRVKDDAGAVDDLARLILTDHGLAIADVDLVASSWPVWPESGVTGELLDGQIYSSVFETSTHTMRLLGRRLQALLVPHHLGHAAYAFHLSGFDEADIIAVDAGGNFTASVVGHGRGGQVRIDQDLAPGNIGSLWSMASREIFGDLLAAGKVMGLAPYGEPKLLEGLLAQYQIDVEGFSLPGTSWTDRGFPGVSFDGGRERWRTRAAQDLAASVQELTNRTMLHLATELRRRTGRSRLCLSGGVALNGIANEQVTSAAGYSVVYVPPAVDDRGLSIGFALYAHAEYNGRRCASVDPRFLGRPHTEKTVDAAASTLRSVFEVRCIGDAGISEAIAVELTQGKTVAVWSGRSESGPRALGHRSILADARRADMAQHLNAVVKHREVFRPFAPALHDNAAPQVCEMNGLSPFMLRVVPLREEVRDAYPAVCHVDGSTRPQTVAPGDVATRLLDEVIGAINATAGVPLVVNTSFNVKGQPIVESPADAATAFRSSSIDTLALGKWLVRR